MAKKMNGCRQMLAAAAALVLAFAYGCGGEESVDHGGSLVSKEGPGLTKLTDNPADDSFPAWRP